MSITVNINYKETPPTKKYVVTLDEANATQLRVWGCPSTSELHDNLVAAGVPVSPSPEGSPTTGTVEAVETPGTKTPDTVTITMPHDQARLLSDYLVNARTWNTDERKSDTAAQDLFSAMRRSGVERTYEP